MEQKTKEYMKRIVNVLEEQISTIDLEVQDMKVEQRRLRKFYKKVISKL